MSRRSSLATRIDPSDGLPAMVVGGSRAVRKHFFLTYYASIMSQMKKFTRRAYVELFAGPGRVVYEEDGSFDDGSPLKAMALPFTEFIFVELNKVSADALDLRVQSKTLGRPTTVLQGDCNERIEDVVRRLPLDGLSLAFVDPTNWQVRFETIAKLAAVPRVDLVVTMFLGSMKRVPAELRPDIDAFFGTDAWRHPPYTHPDGRLTLDGMMSCYREQLATLGYLNRPAAREITVRAMAVGPPLYLIAFFSKHKLGYEFWDKATARDEGGQMTMKF